MNEFEAEEDGFEVDFDRFGYRRDQETYKRIRSTGVVNFGEEDVSQIMIPTFICLTINHSGFHCLILMKVLFVIMHLAERVL